jgi:haloacetate dehalogenase
VIVAGAWHDGAVFDAFQRGCADGAATELAYVIGGSGPPVVLLHGFPQTHVMWRSTAPALAETHTVVAPDLRGYGASPAPPSAPDHAPASFRMMAADVVALMAGLGFERFAVVGHDRGARVAHRLALDHPERVQRAALLDILPTIEMYEQADREFATHYWHWFFLIQPAPFPERLIIASVETVMHGALGPLLASGAVSADAYAAYLAAARDPDVVRGWCEDYRAAATIDLEHDRADRAAGRRVGCPLLVLWGVRNPVWDGFGDVLAVWRQYATDVRGEAIASGHFLPEEAPDATLERLRPFLSDQR